MTEYSQENHEEDYMEDLPKYEILNPENTINYQE